MKKRFIKVNFLLLISWLLLTGANLYLVATTYCGPNDPCPEEMGIECYSYCINKGGCDYYLFLYGTCEEDPDPIPICWEWWYIKCNNGQAKNQECGSFDTENCR